MFENVSLAFQGIWSHKLRSFLTMLGIIIGIASIIIIVSTIKGTNEMIKSNLVGSGTNVVNVRLFQGDNTYDLEYNAVPEGIAPISEEIRQSLADMKNVEAVSLYHSRSYTDGVYYRNTSFSGNLYGVDAYFMEANGYQVTYGRGLLQSDVDALHKVVLLDTGAVTSLSIDGNPIGQTLEIKGEPYTIIGVVSKISQFRPVMETMNEYYQYMGNSSGSIFVPDSTWPEIYRFDEPLSVAVKASSTDNMTSVGQSAAEYLTEQVVLNTQNKFSYRSEDLLEQAKKLQELSSSTNKQLIWIASISLLVGGIGVMNIMLVSVTERTREIGLKKAIGAKRRRILWQFLTEASVMTSLGGILGVGAGIGIARLVSNVMGTPTAVSVPAIVVAVAFSMLIGVVFGLIPALKASKLNPIDALRRE